MIRVFELFCKLNFISQPASAVFDTAMQDFALPKLSTLDLECPCCHAKHPDWSFFGSYERDLISFEAGQPVCHRLSITRLICSSCRHTHAVLPEIIIPHGSYSLLFVLAVLRDYYLHTMTVNALCDRYRISHSTLYAWKNLFLHHKKLWLGLLDDLCFSPRAFLDVLPSLDENLSFAIFFHCHACSFLQGVSSTSRFSSA